MVSFSLAIFLFSGCMSEVERQAQVSQLNLQLEQERQRLDIPKDMWQEYVTNFKDRKCYGYEYQWGRNWRYWAVKDAEEYFTSHPLQRAAVEQARINRGYELLAQEVNQYNQEYDKLNRETHH